jgi:Domain of unknown function (DUF4167)
MRSSKSRSRSKANRPRTLGNIINRVFDSSGPEGKVRGTPQQIIEKYQFLARDAQLSNDRVAAENFNQHAEHYTRMLAEATREMAAEQEARQQQYGQNGNGGQQPQPTYSGNQQPGGNQGNQGNQQPRDRQPRDDRDFRDFRQDRNDRDQRHEDRAPMAIDVVETHDDLGLVDTPEARPQPQPRPDRPRRDDADRPRREAPAAVTAEPAGVAAPAAAVEVKEDRGPRRPRAPRKPKDIAQ